MVDKKELYEMFLQDIKNKGQSINNKSHAQALVDLHLANDQLRKIDPFLNFDPDLVDVHRSLSKIIKIGSSKGIVIDASFLARRGLTAGDNIDVLILVGALRKS